VELAVGKECAEGQVDGWVGALASSEVAGYCQDKQVQALPHVVMDLNSFFVLVFSRISLIFSLRLAYVAEASSSPNHGDKGFALRCGEDRL